MTYEVFMFINNFIQQNGYSPSVREIGKGFKFVSWLHSIWEEDIGVGYGFTRGEVSGDNGVCEGDGEVEALNYLIFYFISRNRNINWKNETILL